MLGKLKFDGGQSPMQERATLGSYPGNGHAGQRRHSGGADLKWRRHREMEDGVGREQTQQQARQPCNRKSEDELVLAVEILRNPDSAH